MLSKTTLPLLISYLFFGTIYSQSSCIVPQILTQEAIDNFATDFPDCTTVIGSLTITDLSGSDITNLDGLAQLQKIEENLGISNVSLPTLQGLHNIESVEGLYIQNSNILSLQGLDNITQVDKEVYLNSLSITSLDGLGNLTSVGEDFEIISCEELTSLSGLTNLTDIGYSFVLKGAPNLATLQGLPMATIHRDIEIQSCDSIINLEGLNQFAGNIESLVIKSNDNLASLYGMENIFVENDIEISNNDLLLNLEGLTHLDSIGGDFTISNNEVLQNLNGLENLVYVDDMEIHNNEILNSLQGLNSVKIIDIFSVEDNPLLIDFSGLDSLGLIGGLYIEDNEMLQSLNGLNNVDTLYLMRIKDNDQLTNLEGLSSLKSAKVGINISSNDGLQSVDGLDSLTFTGYIGMTGNDALKNLDGFKNVTAVDGPIYIQSHDSIVDISGIENIDPATVNEEGGNISSNDFTIRNNPMLGECAIATICTKFSLANATFNIENNAEGCQSVDEVKDQCTIATGITGYIFEDLDQNGVFDNDDIPIANSRVSITLNDDIVAIDYTDNDGLYRIFAPPATYILMYGSENRCYSPAVVDTMVEIVDTAVTRIDFSLEKEEISGLMPDEGAGVYLSRTATRCGFTVRHHVVIYNETCLDSRFDFTYKVDDRIDSIFNISIPDAVLDQNEISYTIPELLKPWAKYEFTFDAIMPGVEAIDSIILDEVIVDYQFPENMDLDGSTTTTFTSPITCAYDPNDKLAEPDRSREYDEPYILNESLIYTIRFQNTGNDTAFTVRLEDEISSFLDIATIRPIQASHDYEFTIDYNSRLITILFNDILLPDSTTNQLGSNGFFTFSILPLGDLDELTVIENYADIFFDFNPPIRTNTVDLVYVSELPVISSVIDAKESHYTIGPNPTNGHLTVTGLKHFQYEFYNLGGQLVSSGSGSTSIEFSREESSMYFLILKNENGQVLGMHKILKQ